MSGTAPPPRREGCAVAAVAAGAARAGHGVRCAARAAMNGMAPPLVEPKERVLQLGETFEKQPRCAFHTVRCELGGVWGGGRCRAPGAGLQAPAWRGAGPRGAHAARGASVPGLEGGGKGPARAALPVAGRSPRAGLELCPLALRFQVPSAIRHQRLRAAFVAAAARTAVPSR